MTLPRRDYSEGLQWEFHLARQMPRHLAPLPLSIPSADPDVVDATAVLERLVHGDQTHQLLLRRLVRVRSASKNSSPAQLLKNRPGLTGFCDSFRYAGGEGHFTGVRSYFTLRRNVNYLQRIIGILSCPHG
jgi:hypothetical protein